MKDICATTGGIDIVKKAAEEVIDLFENVTPYAKLMEQSSSAQTQIFQMMKRMMFVGEIQFAEVDDIANFFNSFNRIAQSLAALEAFCERKEAAV